MIFLQLLISGILIGGVYALISLGLTLIFGVMRIVNFVHGDMLMVAMYFSYWFYTLYSVDNYIGLFLVVPALGLLGALMYRFVIRHAIRRSHEASILVTIGLSIVIQNAALLLWSADYRSIHNEWATRSLQWGDLRISSPLLIAFIVALVVTGILFAFLHRTYLGKAIRAASMDRFAAVLMGVHPQRIFTLSFAIGIALVGVAGALLSSVFAVHPTLGTQFLLVSFVVVVLGGLGSLRGAILGGLLIGVVETTSAYFIGSSMKQLVYLLLFIVILIVKPAGLFGKRIPEVNQ
ncbi:MAG: branched-chain amino acid ABC transporter permease [Firmicutes bacterium]|uniref:Branched-chain amino acid transport system permease protein n=1 Tax=Melghirimyces thermohalophilus TaxID=1236220 RepID=A0A1G6ITX7_9BACL|nr:branched-chain amino acid ABC transporter permease [Melghirimyces thermohalophilus]MDA8351594.1 branched-chain amino acid ABC transporter permease [Bacillota bacterium]SDC09226.1 branched-chain amino acid transport system permease protein [Melghirimyces thermohalophilus]